MIAQHYTTKVNRKRGAGQGIVGRGVLARALWVVSEGVHFLLREFLRLENFCLHRMTSTFVVQRYGALCNFLWIGQHMQKFLWYTQVRRIHSGQREASQNRFMAEQRSKFTDYSCIFIYFLKSVYILHDTVSQPGLEKPFGRKHLWSSLCAEETV